MKAKENQAANTGAKKTTKKGSTAAKIAGGVLAGAAVGALVGVLTAPDSGKNTRKKISAKSKKVVDDVKAKVSKIKERLPLKKKSASSGAAKK